MKSIKSGLLFIMLLLAVSSSVADDYYFDAGWRNANGINSAFRRIESIIKINPDAQTEILIHGRDVKLFAQSRSSQHSGILSQSRQLASHANIKFKVCDHALLYQNLSTRDLPDYFNTVYYIPEYIRGLQQKGYKPVDLNALGNK